MALINWTRDRDLFPSLPNMLEDLRSDGDFLASFLNGKKIPAVNISETDTSFLVEVAAPGMEKKDFDVSLQEGMLSIKAEKEEKSEKKEKNYHRREYSFDSFERKFRLPDHVSSDKIEAKYDNGVLKISLQKLPSKAAKKIEVAVD